MPFTYVTKQAERSQLPHITNTHPRKLFFIGGETQQTPNSKNKSLFGSVFKKHF